MKFQLFGIKICVEFSFVLIIAFALLFYNYDILWVVLFSAAHELGHIVSLYLVGGKADKIVIAYYGIGLKHNCKLSFAKQLIFLLSGVATNLILALFNVKPSINLILAVLNVLPLYPLDGGRALKLIMDKYLTINNSDKIYKIISIAIIIVMVVYDIYLKNISLLLITIYIIVYSFNNSYD